MKKLLLLSLLFVTFSKGANAQVNAIEGAFPSPEIISNNDFNKIEYDRCTGTLNIALESTKNTTGGYWPIKYAIVYIKIGGEWKELTHMAAGIHFFDDGTNGLATGHNVAAWQGTDAIGPVISAGWNPPFYQPLSAGLPVRNDKFMYDGVTAINNIWKRMGYFNGAYNHHWFGFYWTLPICSEYSTSLDLVSNTKEPIFVPWEDASRLDETHSTNIGKKMANIGFYPTNGSEWGIQMGVTNIPHEAMVSDVIDIRIWKWTGRAGAFYPDPQNAFQVLELATSVNAVDAPFGLSTTDDECGQVTLNWQNPTQSWSSSLNCTNVMEYRNVVLRNNVKIAVLHGDSTSYVDADPVLQQREQYDYTVRKILWNIGNQTYRSSGVSNVASGSMKMPPAQPSPFSATDYKCDTLVSLSWTQPPGTASDEYILQRYIGTTFRCNIQWTFRF